jgi:hypothetical protein
MQPFFVELQRRHVYRVGAAYVVAAWLATQVVTQVCPVYGLSAIYQKTIVTCLIGAFPIVLVIAWVSHKASAIKANEACVPAAKSSAIGAHETFGPAMLGILALLGVLAIGVTYGLRSLSSAATLVVDDERGARDLLPLRHGRYSSSTCVDPANAALLFYDGRSLNGVHSAGCKLAVIQHTAKSYLVTQTCRAEQVASAIDAPPIQLEDTLVVLSRESFELWTNDTSELRTFRRCSME